jgi:hypothetical protein
MPRLQDEAAIIMNKFKSPVYLCFFAGAAGMFIGCLFALIGFLRHKSLLIYLAEIIAAIGLAAYCLPLVGALTMLKSKDVPPNNPEISN